MADELTSTTGMAVHGTSRLPSVEVDAFSMELKDEDGFLGDRARKDAFVEILNKWRKPLQKSGEDPFGEAPERISRKTLDKLLVGNDMEASAIVHSAIEDFAQQLAYVTKRLLKTKAWNGTERIVVGGGFCCSRLGELAIARSEIILKADDLKTKMLPIRFDPDDAALIGALHLVPSWIFEAYDSILAVDIGGTNIRCGLVNMGLDKAPDFSKACVSKLEHWRHADENPTRGAAVKRLIKMLKNLIAKATKQELRLAPFVGIGCPGVIRADGSIEKGAQNLPGDWANAKFNLPASIIEAIPQIGRHDTAVFMHNDAVVQGLAEVPFMQDVSRWGVLTIGTGLGNARFTNRGPTDRPAGHA